MRQCYPEKKKGYREEVYGRGIYKGITVRFEHSVFFLGPQSTSVFIIIATLMVLLERSRYPRSPATFGSIWDYLCALIGLMTLVRLKLCNEIEVEVKIGQRHVNYFAGGYIAVF